MSLNSSNLLPTGPCSFNLQWHNEISFITIEIFRYVHSLSLKTEKLPLWELSIERPQSATTHADSSAPMGAHALRYPHSLWHCSQTHPYESRTSVNSKLGFILINSTRKLSTTTDSTLPIYSKGCPLFDSPSVQSTAPESHSISCFPSVCSNKTIQHYKHFPHLTPRCLAH